MKKMLKELVLLFVIVFGVLALITWGKKLKNATYNDKSKASVSLSFKEEKGYELSESKVDLRTSLEDEVLKGDDFNIAIQVDEYSSNKTFNGTKKFTKGIMIIKKLHIIKLREFLFIHHYMLDMKLFLM